MYSMLAPPQPFEVTSVERRPAVAGYLHLLRNTFLQSGSSHNDLEHGSWGKLRLNGFVEERVIIIIDQLRPFILFYAHRKVVRVIRRPADHRQNLARPRIEGHDRTVPSIECLLSSNLQININRQLKLFPRLGRLLFLLLPHLLAVTVHHHLARTILAHQEVVVLQLHSGLAHHIPGVVELPLRLVSMSSLTSPT